MATVLPRTFSPQDSTDLWLPTVLKDISQAGIVQVRATKRAGFWWEETFGLMSLRDVDAMEVKALIDYAYSRGEVLTMKHLRTPGSGIAPNGLGTAAILVKGAAQVGNTIITDAWPISTSNCVRAGDVIKLAGDNGVYQVRASAGSDGSGDCTIPIMPNLRKSPIDNAAVTNTDVEFDCLVWERSKFNAGRAPNYYAGLKITLVEALI